MAGEALKVAVVFGANLWPDGCKVVFAQIGDFREYGELKACAAAALINEQITYDMEQKLGVVPSIGNHIHHVRIGSARFVHLKGAWQGCQDLHSAL